MMSDPAAAAAPMLAPAVQLQPPEKFDVKRPDEWPRWKRRFEQFLVASGLDKGEEARKVSTLLYCLGVEGDEVLTSTNATEEDRKQYSTVIAKLDEYYQVRRNVIYECARFNRRDQEKDETAEQYISALYTLVEHCEYGDMKEELLRDRLVIGVRDTALSDKLQLDATLTLEKAKTAIRQKEATKEHRQELKGTGSKADPYLVEEVRRNQGSKVRAKHKGTSGPSHGRPSQKKGGATPQPSGNGCMRCGKDRHPTINQCPALGATCYKCNRKGHYGTQCRSKTVAAAEEITLDAAFLGAVQAGVESPWTSTIKIQGVDVTFKLDTGAGVSAISEKVFQMLPPLKLRKPSLVLFGPTRQKLDVLGQFIGNLAHRDETHRTNIFVVRGLQNNLLGLSDIKGLNLIRRLDAVNAKTEVTRQFPSVFKGLGTLGGAYKVQLREDAQPFALHTPRRVPFPLCQKVKEELQRMEAAGVISKVSDPTPWCAGMVVVRKKSGAVRICVDLKPLNESVLREVHPIPHVDEILARISGATVFSKLDANSGFWQIPLAPESRLLTTFITLYGRFCFNKLPFGISSAPELFQKRMNVLLEGLDGVVCLIDDVLIHGKDQEEHDARLRRVLERLDNANVTLNLEKCEFSKDSVKFLGYVVDRHGVRADPEKTSAICQMDAPCSVSELRRFLGMVNQLGKFSPRISELTEPLRQLLSSKRAWLWGPDQDQAFAKVKEELTQSTVLALYDPNAETKVSADASSFGLGAVLFQRNNEDWRPVVYASRSMTETERRYAQIEKEALAVTWACDKFSDYLLGRRFDIESDHKPLIPLLNSKQLDSLPPRVLRFRLRLARYEYQVHHVPGKLLFSADAFSRAPVASTGDGELEEVAEEYVDTVTSHSLPITEKRLEVYRQEQEKDHVCALVREYCRSGWPDKGAVQPEVAAYWRARGALSECNGVLLFADRIVVPKSLQKETLAKIHEGHQGIERCRARVAASVWWPGVSQQMAQIVQQCKVCARDAKPNKEPLIVTTLPDYPWQVVGTDLFEMDGTNYLLTVDYYSRFPEVTKLASTTSGAVISTLKSTFARHGIPEVVRSDNGPQYASQEFAQFASAYEFKHTTSSPRYPQSNGQAERMVQTVKKMIKQSGDPHLALLSYRSTPLPWCQLSPAELCMGRKIRSLVPQTNKHLIPQWPYLKAFQEENKKFKDRQKKYFDRGHRARDLSPIPDNTDVWIKSEEKPVPGTVLSPAKEPRSYIVETPSGLVHRNRGHLNVQPKIEDPSEDTAAQEVPPTSPSPSPSPPQMIMTRTRTGTAIRPPDRLA